MVLDKYIVFMLDSRHMRKKILSLSVLAAMLGLGISTATQAPVATKAVDSPLVTQVDKQQSQLDNHEARISNTENDVKDLQDKTGTPPSTTRVTVPVAMPGGTIIPVPVPGVEPVKVVNAVLRIAENGGHYCDLTYSDGSVLAIPSAYHMDVFGNSGYDDNCPHFLGQTK
jgi:cell division protein FtsB